MGNKAANKMDSILDKIRTMEDDVVALMQDTESIAHKDGYKDGYEEGVDSGFEAGKIEGKKLGSEEGFFEGYDAGFLEGGYAVGFSEGYAKAEEDGKLDKIKQSKQKEVTIETVDLEEI